MKNKSLKIPTIIIAIGLVLSVLAYFLTAIVKEPVITEHDFDFTVTYQLDGETKILEGVYRCRFRSTGDKTVERYYEGSHLSNPSEEHPSAYTIAQKDGLELCIVIIFSDRYFMDDADELSFHYDPYLAVMDKEGMEYDDEQTVGKFDAELIGWEYPEPVGNDFKFVGFSKLNDTSMMAMLLVGIFVIVACMIFARREKTVSYKVLDKISIVLNFIIGIAAIPFITLVVWLMQIYVSEDALIYQIDLCVPAITALSIAASVSLRRKGFTKIGFFVQLIGPVLFVLLGILEPIM